MDKNPIQDLLDQAMQEMHDVDKVQDLLVAAFTRGVQMGTRNILEAYKRFIDGDLEALTLKDENDKL